MASAGANTIYRCHSAFSVWQDGVPRTYPTGYEVMGDDPILQTHSSYFERADVKVRSRSRAPRAVETATMDPDTPGRTTSPLVKGRPEE